MMLVLTASMMVFTIAALFGGSADPVSNHALAMLVYVLPVLIIVNAILLLFWLIRRRFHWASMPALSLLCCIPYIGTVYQPGLFHSNNDEKTGVMLATYNVAAFGRETSGFKSSDILANMKTKNVDIFCVQEYSDISGDRLNSNTYRDYFHHMAFGRNDMIIYSRYPIKQSQVIDFGDTNNSGMWADIEINDKTIRVFNVHLETTGFNRTLSEYAKREMKGQVTEENALIKAIYNNYTLGMIIRSRQAKLVSQEIKNSPLPVIVCGDLNDVPYSYTYKTVMGDLVDGFKECGSGFMSTYRGAKQFRIDYIFHDKSITGLNYYKQELYYSDHNPVYMKIAL